MNRPRKNQLKQTNSPFKNLRLQADLTQEQLARTIGVLKDTATHIAVSTTAGAVRLASRGEVPKGLAVGKKEQQNRL